MRVSAPVESMMVVDIDADTDDVRHNRIASAADVMRAILIDWIGLDWIGLEMCV